MSLLLELSTEIADLAGCHGASNIRVTGSVARAEADAESDIDLIVDLAPDRDVSDLSELRIDFETLLGYPVEVFVIPRNSDRPEGSHAALMLRDALPVTGTPRWPHSAAERDHRRLQSLSDQLIQVVRDTQSGASSLDDHLVFDATVQRLRWIAHAASRLSAETTSRHPNIRWKAIAGFARVAEHSRALMWEIVATHLPPLGEAVGHELLRHQGVEPSSD